MTERERWEQECLAPVLGKSGERRARFQTTDDIEIDRVFGYASIFEYGDRVFGWTGRTTFDLDRWEFWGTTPALHRRLQHLGGAHEVVPGQTEPADRCLFAEASMRSVPIVAMQP